MEKFIDKTDIDGQLETIIRDVFMAYRNRKARKNFLEVTKDLNPQSCFVKTGWRSGEYFFFACKFTKNGEGDIFKEIVKGMPEKVENLHFLYGLNPKIFHFEPLFFLDEPEHFSLAFKLEREK